MQRTVYIPKEMQHMVEAYAKKRDLSFSKIVQKAIKQYMRKKRRK